MKTGPYPDFPVPDFLAMPMALSNAWMDMWLMPMRLSMAFFAQSERLPGRPVGSSTPSRAKRTQSDTDRIIAKSEDELAEMDEAPADTKVNLSALVS